METIVYDGVSLEVPSDICQDINLLFDIISPDTWNNHLTDENREMLMGFLPDFPEDDLEEKTRTLEMFFMDENFRHGTPLRIFHDHLTKGFFNPEIKKMRDIHKKILYKEYRYRQKQYLHHTLEEVLVRRKRVLDIVNTMPPDDIPKIPRIPSLHNKKKSCRTSIEYCTKKRYFRELAAIRAEVGDTSDLSDDEIYPEGPGASLNKKQRRQLGGLEGSLPSDLLPIRATHSSGSLALDLELKITPTNNPLDLTDDHFRAMLSSHRQRRNKRETSIDLDTRGITLQDIVSRAQLQNKKIPQKLTLSPLMLEKPKKKMKVKKEPPPPPPPPTVLADLPISIKAEPLSDSESSSSSSSSSSGSDSEEVEVKNEAPVIPPPNVIRKRPPSKTDRIKVEPIDPIPPPLQPQPTPTTTSTTTPVSKNDIDIGGLGMEPIVSDEVIKTEVKEEPMEDQVTAAAIENSSELTAALESIGACIAPELTQETHICFFSLIRDIICSTGEQRMTKAQLESSIRVWQESAISPLNEWYSVVPSWVNILASAINFLCGHFTDVQPVDFVPYIEYKSLLRVYQWIGAGRDSDGHLEPLAQFWLANKASMSSEWIEDDVLGSRVEIEESDVIPPPRCYTNWTVQAATDNEKEMYRVQEKIRYEKPHKAYTFRMHGYESVVGPVKGIYTQQTGVNKARGHSLLVPDRPAYVTILSLVRDAVARLPNGEGTRSDICELLKESQYLAPLTSPTAENNLNSVVSGALDRLHYENDPCVKYDTPRKLWIYLHRNRNEEEFERMHHLNGPGGSKNKKPAPRRQSRAKIKDPLTIKGPPNVTLEPIPSPVTKVEPTQLRLKPEDVAVLAKAKVDTPVKLEHLGSPTVGKTITSVRMGNVRGAVGTSSVQTIQVSTAGGVQTIKVALPPGTQTITKMTPQTLAKVPTSSITKLPVAGQSISRTPAPTLTKATAASLKGVNIQQSMLQSAVSGTTLNQETILASQHITNLTSNNLTATKSRSPIVTLTTREGARIPNPSIAQARPSVSASTSVASQQLGTQTSLTSQVVTTASGHIGNKLAGAATVVNMGGSAMHKANLFSLGGIKLLQATPQQVAASKGKTVRSASPAVMNNVTKLQTLMVDGKVLMPGGKVVTVESLLSQADKTTQIQGGGLTTIAGNKLAGGNVIQVAGGAGGVQRLTLVSPQGTHVPLTAANQRLILATGSQGNKIDGNKTQVVQTIQTLQPGGHVVQTSQGTMTTTSSTTTTPSINSTTTQVISGPIASTPATTSQARFFSVGGQQQKTIVQECKGSFIQGAKAPFYLKGVGVTGKPSVLSGSGIRLVQPAVSGAMVAGSSTATGNLITIGGKQVLLTSKPFPQQQLQQVMLTGGSIKGGTATTQTAASQGAVMVASGTGGQQIVLPASALQGSHLNLKGVQAFQTLKVIPASQVTQQQRGKPVLARIVSPAAVRGATPVTTTVTANLQTSHELPKS